MAHVIDRRGPPLLRSCIGGHSSHTNALRHTPSQPSLSYYAPQQANLHGRSDRSHVHGATIVADRVVGQPLGYLQATRDRSGGSVLAWRERMQSKRRGVTRGMSGCAYLDHPPSDSFQRRSPSSYRRVPAVDDDADDGAGSEEVVRYHQLASLRWADPPYRPPRPQWNPQLWAAETQRPLNPWHRQQWVYSEYDRLRISPSHS